jgi:hypothetical protein
LKDGGENVTLVPTPKDAIKRELYIHVIKWHNFTSKRHVKKSNQNLTQAKILKPCIHHYVYQVIPDTKFNQITSDENSRTDTSI